MTDLSHVFGAEGLLGARLSGFRHRAAQQQMAEAIAELMDGGGVLICEAGTGTGKTFAYLVPALLAGRKVILSTGTRTLQDQLFHRDLPLVRAALGLPVSVALLKGRANYLCRHRLSVRQAEVGQLEPELRGQLRQVRDWAQTTRSGDIAELALPEQARIWPEVTSTTDNCLGQECPEWDRCHLVAARRQAQSADVVVVNHHLFCADLALKDGGFGEILPGVDCFVLDEAHQLPDIASSFFGISVSSRQLMDLARDTELEGRREAADAAVLGERAGRLKHAVQDLRLALGDGERRGPWQQLDADPQVVDALERMTRRVSGLLEALAANAGRGKGLDACQARAADLLERLQQLQSTAAAVDDGVRWFETQGRGLRLHRTPLEVAEPFREQINRPGRAWVFTSATLAVGDSFTHFSRQLGIENPRTACYPSPFDYRHQALWLVPRGLPQPAEASYNAAVTALALEVLTASRGRAFLLFTSHKALREVAQGLAGRIPYPLLAQGEAPRAELLERFRVLGNAVLLGTSSFWEGVDVRGEALSCVLIDRLPFASPGDPVLAARIEALRRQGGNPFRDFQLPRAVIALKQGAGRLIRGDEDRGVLVVCDPRLLSRSYGYTFLESLPPMARTRQIEEVQRFFAEPVAAAAAAADADSDELAAEIAGSPPAADGLQ